MARIAVGGLHHETNSFSPVAADLAAFSRTATLPGLTVGEAIPPRFSGLNTGLAGAIERLGELGHKVLPTLWASAVPSGPVTAAAFEELTSRLIEAIAAARPDAVLLDLHGAMIAEGIADAEARILTRLREAIGLHVPVVACFDLHANLSQTTVLLLDALAIFRTYPHLDMALTGRRAADLLDARLLRSPPFAVRMHKGDYLIPLHAQATGSGAARELYPLVEAVAARPGIAFAELALGFPPGDIAHCGPTIVVGAESGRSAEAAVAELAEALAAAEPDFAVPVLEPAEAVRRAIGAGAGPIILADTQDNPGAGGTGDTVGVLRELIIQDASDAVVALVWDEAAIARARAIGVGKSGEITLGTRDAALGGPLTDSFLVEALKDGPITATGPMYRGNVWDLGTLALLRCRGVRVIVAERRLQAADRALLAHVGIDADKARIIALKSTVHFRADFEPIARQILIVAAPGLHAADNNAYAYTRLRPSVRRMPRHEPR